MSCSSGSGAAATSVTDPRPVRGVILAGGQASRFGGALKGLERVGGVRILDRLIDAFESAFGHLPLLIANHPDARSWRADLEVVPDIRPGLGSLGGLYTAVVAGPAPVVVTGWDMPFVKPGLLTRLAHGLAEADACLPWSNGPRGMEPMCAAYSPGCVAAITESLDQGDLRAVAFHDRIRLSILSQDEVARYGEPSRLFFNVNTAADLQQADALWQTPGSSP